MLGTNAVVINNARLGIQARGDINGYDTIGAFIDRRNPNGERRTQIPVETGTKNGIDNNIGLIDQNLEFVTRGADANVKKTLPGVPCASVETPEQLDAALAAWRDEA